MDQTKIERPQNPKEFLRSGIIIGGEWHDSGSGGEREHIDPSTGLVQQTFTVAGQIEVEAAVDAANMALPSWRFWPAAERQRILNRLGSLIREHGRELAVINALEVGTPAALSAQRYLQGPNFFEYYAGWIEKAAGDTVRRQGGLDFTTLEPVGVVGAILTWNHPLANIQTTVAPALAAGCCVVIKPPEQAPFAALKFGQLCIEAGVPPGVVSVLPGTGEVGAALVSHPGVDMISFVGGTAIGRDIQENAARTLKPLLLELGGKSPSLVFKDADIANATAFALRIASNTGQGCTIPTRMLVHEDIYDDVLDRLRIALPKISVGDPFKQGVTMGPLINQAALDRVLSRVTNAVDRGEARLVTGGKRIGTAGYFVEPTLLSDVDTDSEIAQEEVFGPVLAMSQFSTEEEAISIANTNPYGLAAYVHTLDTSRAMRVASKLDAGNIGINGGGAPAGPHAPFGGIKQSGYGKVGGLAGFMQFTRVKSISLNIEGEL